MTLKLLPVLLVALGASSVNAADVVKVSEQDNAPAILNSVQSDSVQVLSKADADKVRGEYQTSWYRYGNYLGEGSSQYGYRTNWLGLYVAETLSSSDLYSGGWEVRRHSRVYRSMGNNSYYVGK